MFYERGGEGVGHTPISTKEGGGVLEISTKPVYHPLNF